MAMFTILPRTVAQYLADNTYDLTGVTAVKVALLDSALVLFPAWAASTAYAQHAVRQPTTPTGWYYVAQGAGTSGATEPTWPTDGSSVVDGSITWEQASQVLPDGTVDYSAYLPSYGAEPAVWADVSANEITGTGYTAGGATLANVSLANTGLLTQVLADDTLWPSATLTARYAVVYLDATLNGVVKPIIELLVLDDTPADVTPSGVDFSILWGTNGVFRVPAGCQL